MFISLIHLSSMASLNQKDSHSYYQELMTMLTPWYLLSVSITASSEYCE
jgi:hypothetical protein